MHILIAPDKFKGCLTAPQAAAAMARGARKIYPEATISTLPIADGGDGTLEVLVTALGGEYREAEVTGPLGDRITARWGLCHAGGDPSAAPLAIIEMAEASGLKRLPDGRRDILHATTRGTGELMLAALDAGVRRFIVGIGGSATNDGGTGMASALGARFLDAGYEVLPDGAEALRDLAAIDSNHLDRRLLECDISIATDVSNVLCGLQGAAAVYGPQKGARPEEIPRLDEALAHYARIAQRGFNVDVANFPGAGAAGGLGAGLMFFARGKMVPGIELMLNTIGLEDKLDGVDLIITGEGRTDASTACGKAPAGLARQATAHGIPVLVVSGALDPDVEALEKLGISALESIIDRPMTLEECIAGADPLLERATARALRLVRIGSQLHI